MFDSPRRSNRGLLPTLARVVADRTSQPYGERFFAGQRAGARLSASVIVPLIVDAVAPQSVVDVGCGVGAWLSVFKESGVNDVLGLDGDYVKPEQMEIQADEFRAVDLSTAVDVGRRFDLAISMEVAEHLPRSSAAAFVTTLCRAADFVLFSAAIPRQGGSGHLNEQWQDWWASHFASHGFVAVDCVRPVVWSNPDVEWWYAQNALLYVSRSALVTHPRLNAQYETRAGAPLSIVHPDRYLKWRIRLGQARALADANSRH